MKRLLIAAIAAATFCATSALAADLPTKAPAIAAPVPMLNWTGFYIGIEGGGAWGLPDMISPVGLERTAHLT